MIVTRTRILVVARSYLGTPFHHRGRVPGTALDCAGILICIARRFGIVEPTFDVPPYTMNPDGSSLLGWCNQYLEPVAEEAMRPGDIVVLAVEKDPQHLAILGDYVNGGLSIIHAANSAHPPRVIETRLLFSRIQKFVAAYAFPGVI